MRADPSVSAAFGTSALLGGLLGPSPSAALPNGTALQQPPPPVSSRAGGQLLPLVPLAGLGDKWPHACIIMAG